MISEPWFHNEDAAYSFCESRLWPAGPVCPQCRSTGERIRRLRGMSTQRGTYKCYVCSRRFTVKIGTVFESSHLDLHLWLQAIYLVSFATRPVPGSFVGKRVSVRQLQRTLGVALRIAWRLNRRIRDLTGRDDRSRAIAGEGHAAVLVDTMANARTVTAGHDHKKLTGTRTGSGPSPALKGTEAGRSKGRGHGDSGERRLKRGRTSRAPGG